MPSTSMARTVIAGLTVPFLVVLLAACGDAGDPPSTDETEEPDSSQDLGAAPEVEVPDGPAPTELTVDDLVVGDGEPATPGARVQVHYVGVLYDTGEEFDSSWERGQPVTFPLGNVVPGFAQGIAGTDAIEPMRVGGRRWIAMPPDLAYADTPPPGSGIPSGATLVFVVDLLGVE